MCQYHLTGRQAIGIRGGLDLSLRNSDTVGSCHVSGKVR